MTRRITGLSEYEVTVLKDGGEEQRIAAPGGALFLQLLKGNGYPLVCCNGKGGCGRCRIRFPDGNAPLPSPADRNALTAEELREGIRLACVHRVKRDCRIRVEFVQPKQIEILAGSAGSVHIGYPEGSAAATENENAAAALNGEPYVLAVDLGTTTIVANAMPIAMFQRNPDGVPVLAAAGRMNPQRQWGSDVISRIQAAVAGAGKELQEVVRSAVSELAEDIAEQMGALPERICLAGNTVMEHLFLGWDVRGLGEYPFRPVSLKEQETEIFLNSGGRQRAYPLRLLPGISAFVGADVLAGLLICGFGNPQDSRCRLFIDLGTNGEMAIGNGERLICTATAAGPAFEGGANANVPGTDMIALLARLLREGKIDRTGLLRDDLFEEGWQEDGVRLTQRDIRALQVAKAAVCAGVELLMQRLGVGCCDVAEVYLAGGFGCYLDVGSAAEIGLFPAELSGKVRAVGNTSVLGAAFYGAVPGLPERAEALARSAEVMNLAEEPGFEERYLERMGF